MEALWRNWLQWGHDEGVVENVIFNVSVDREVALQWGHDEGVVENKKS